jgi:hypothetical protein
MDKLHCTNCGADNRPNSRYCSQCGYALPGFKTEDNSIRRIESVKETKNNKKAILTTSLGVIFSGLVYFAVQHFLFKPPTFDKILMSAASEINKTCPIMIDQETRLDNALAMPNNTLQYNYTLINLDKSDIIVDTLKKYIEPNIINNIKSNPDLKAYRDNKTTMTYYYRDKDGDFVYKLEVTPEMYK